MRRLLKVFTVIILLFTLKIYSEEKGRYYSEIELLSQPWDTIQKVYGDFNYLFKIGDIKGVLDENSIGVYELEGEKEVEVLSDFIKEEDGAGYIIFQVKGEKDPEKSVKKFRIYFDVKGQLPYTKREKLSIKETNLVPNIGFEEEEKEGIPARTPYFYSAGMKEVYLEGRILLDKGVYYKGTKSIKLIGKEEKLGSKIIVTPYPGYKKDGFPYAFRVKPGTSYKFGYWVKGENCANPKYISGLTSTIVLSWINWYDKDGNYLSRDEIKGIKCSQSELPYSWDWVYNESIFKPPSNAYYGLFEIGFPCYQGSVWVDEPLIDFQTSPVLTSIYKK